MLGTVRLLFFVLPLPGVFFPRWGNGHVPPFAQTVLFQVGLSVLASFFMLLRHF